MVNFRQWFTLWVKHKQIGQLLVPIPFSNFASLSISTLAVGFEIYVIGGLVDGNPSSAVRIINCRSHTCGYAPSMNVAREYASVCVYDGKIYVLGGCKRLKEDEPWAEVFDTKTQTWERLSDPGTEIRKCVIYGIVEMEGKIYFETKCNRYAYDTKHGKWECCEDGSAKFVFMRSGCVMENVLYVYSQNSIWWYDIKGGGNWKKVKGLDSLAKEHMIRNGGSSDSRTVKLVNCGGKLLLIWEDYTKSSPNYMKKIWCAQIVLEKYDGGEVWGNVECVDVMHTITTSSYLSHALVVSV